MRLVEAENLHWRLFRVSDQRLMKWIGKSCSISELGLHLNYLLKYNIVLTPHCHESCISYLFSIVNPTNMQWVAAIFNVFENYPGAHLGDFQYYKGRKCRFHDSRELIQCCMYTIDADREVGMAQFKCQLSSVILQDFPYHFMSLWSETRKRRRCKFPASTSLPETSPNLHVTCKLWICKPSKN